MKFRKLKKIPFVLDYEYMSSDCEEFYNGYIEYNGETKPVIYWECEYDNGLYTKTWMECCEISWKFIKDNLKNKAKDSIWGPKLLGITLNTSMKKQLESLGIDFFNKYDRAIFPKIKEVIPHPYPVH